MAFDGTENISIPTEVDLRTKGGVILYRTSSPDRRGSLVVFSPTGREAWSVDPPVNHLDVRGSLTSQLIAADGKDSGFSLYRADTGKLVYESHDADESYVLFHGGFAVSPPESSPGALTVYDTNGEVVSELRPFRLSDIGNTVLAQSRDTTMIPVRLVGTTDRGVVSVNDGSFEPFSPGFGFVDVIGGRYLVSYEIMAAEMRRGMVWEVNDVETGTRTRTVASTSARELTGFDGERLVVDGDPDPNRLPSIPQLTAIDIGSGRLAWRLPPTEHGSRWVQIGPRLYLVGAGMLARYK
ncbi:hypothetical protein JVX90_09725 [Gordonia sp. PDNC005]|uniref:hypothetical protein n=1 Tax=unclassified Gordonia (in: high G+C Gram-positive bacteria) TaxID=2657482 RepID=UPI001966CA3E|nr:hypothetical protein [Gordonia sp. PDNC005]QRY64415.1 hypothetical protein JVX90_09725 [Gordonia sp. PDNC005]